MITKQSDYHQRPRKKNIQLQEEMNVLPIISGLRLFSNQKGKKKPNKILTLSPILLINALEDGLRKKFEI